KEQAAPLRVGPVVGERAKPTTGITRRRLDEQHVRTKVGEQPARVARRHPTCQIQHPQSRQCTCHRPGPHHELRGKYGWALFEAASQPRPSILAGATLSELAPSGKIDTLTPTDRERSPKEQARSAPKSGATEAGTIESPPYRSSDPTSSKPRL